MGKWGKWVMLLVVAMAFAIPAWAVNFTLGGKYEIQGRYYANPNIVDIPNNLTFPTTDMYLKQYFNLYPTIQVNEKIKIVADLEVFDNKISRDDEVNWDGIYQAYSEFVPTGAITNPGQTGSKLNTRNYKPYSQYNTFTVDQLYCDATTNIGKFIVGKTKDYTGIGWFIQAPSLKDWTFGIIWNKKQELGTALGTINNNNTGDQDEFAGVVKFQNATDMLDFRLAYKYSGAGHAQTRVWYPHFWYNHKFSDLVKINTKFGYGTGPLLKTSSPVGTATGAEKDWKVNNAFGGWIGVGITPGNAGIQIDAVYMSGAKKPYEVSAYLEDQENLDSWLMNDVHDIYAYALETYATQAALGDPRVDGNYSFTNVILGRLNLAYKFTEKLKGDLNFVYAQKQNTDYLKNWYWNSQASSLLTLAPGLTNALYPTLTEGYIWTSMSPAVMPTPYVSNVKPDLGWELRARLNYQWMDNLSFGLDACYYQPGKYYKNFIETDLGRYATTGTGKEMKNTYAARWIAKVTF